MLFVLIIIISDESGAYQDFWYSLKLPTVSSSSNPNVASGTGHIFYLSTQINAVPRRSQFTFSNLSMASNSSLLGITLQPVYASIISPRNDTFFFGMILCFVLLILKKYLINACLALQLSTMIHQIFLWQVQRSPTPNPLFFSINSVDLHWFTRCQIFLVRLIRLPLCFFVLSTVFFSSDLNASNPFTIPDSATIYGQSLLCLSLTPSAIDQLGVDYRIYNPKIYASTYSPTSASSLPAGLATIYPRLALFLSGTRNTSTAAADWSKISTQNGVQFTHFTKNPKWAQDLYGNLVAPYFKTSLWVETWMRPFQVFFVFSIVLLYFNQDFPVQISAVIVSTGCAVRSDQCLSVEGPCQVRIN
jgi:hypothetical protein